MVVVKGRFTTVKGGLVCREDGGWELVEGKAVTRGVLGGVLGVKGTRGVKEGVT